MAHTTTLPAPPVSARRLARKTAMEARPRANKAVAAFAARAVKASPVNAAPVHAAMERAAALAASVDLPGFDLAPASFARLRDGSWGLRIVGEAQPGDAVRATRRDGSSSIHIVGEIVWCGQGVTLAEICTDRGRS
jgi:hypothetical protein